MTETQISELVARINTVLRRFDPGGAEGKVSVGLISMNTVSRQVFLDDTPTHIGPTEYGLLEFFRTRRIVPSVARSCSITSGVPMYFLKNVPWMCISGV